MKSPSSNFFNACMAGSWSMALADHHKEWPMYLVIAGIFFIVLNLLSFDWSES